MSNEDTLKSIGKLLRGDEPRDAIHVAVAPVIAAGTMLKPGQRVRLDKGAAVPCVSMIQSIGVIDPFLNETVEKGHTCWVFLNPGSITTLRHEWTHPAFAESNMEKSAAQQWMDAYAASLGVSTGDLLWNAIQYQRKGEYWSEGDKFEGMVVPDAFWTVFEKLTGSPVKELDRGNFFSCSC